MEGLTPKIRSMREEITTVEQAVELNESARRAAHLRIPHRCKECGAFRFLYVTVDELFLRKVFSGAAVWGKKPCFCKDSIYEPCGKPQQYTGCVDKNNIKVFEGDKLRIPVLRLSGSQSTWCQVRNNEHGLFWLDGSIVWDIEACAFRLHIDRDKIKALEQPRGNEKVTQCVNFHCDLDAAEYRLFQKVCELKTENLINRELNKTHKNIEVIGHIHDGRTDNT